MVKKNKKSFLRKAQVPQKSSIKRNPQVKICQEDDNNDSDDSTIDDDFPRGYSSEETDDTDDTPSTTISQEFSDEEKLLEYYESKVRGNGLFGPAADGSGSEGDIPRQLQGMMDGFRKQYSQSQQDRKVISSKSSTEHKTEKPSGETKTSKRKVGRSNRVSNKLEQVDLKHQQKLHRMSSYGYNNERVTGKKQISKVKKRVPPKEEEAFQKSNFTFSDYSRSSERKSKPEESRKAKEGGLGDNVPRRRPTKNPIMGLAEARKKSSADKVSRSETKERRNKIIEYLCQIDDAEKALQSRGKAEDGDSSDAVDALTSRDAVLKKYGFELTSQDELLKLGGAADRKRRREKRKILFPSSSSSSSGSDKTLNEEEVKSTLKSFLGEGGSDVDVSELVRHGRKWRNCLEDGECQCRPRTEKEEEQIKEDHNKNLQQFLNIFDGKAPTNHEYTREDLLKAHEKIGPWVHDKTKRLDKFIESGKYSPQYLLNIWDGRFSGDSSGDEPDFDKYREEYKKKLTKAQEDGTPLPPEDRVPTLEENNWYLFPTPVTRMYGNGETPSQRKPNSRAAMEAIASDLRRKREIDRAKEYLAQGTFPEPHLYPRPEHLKEEPNQIRNNLLGLFPPTPENK